jgi:ribonucleoside-diphosphate reductase beta chain
VRSMKKKMNTSIFNEEKTPQDYRESSSLFFGPNPGLFDTLNKPYPKIWSLYKTMKSLDWDENEFDYSVCNIDFKNCPKSVYDCMIRTLAWQWEADSVASRSIAPLLAPFITDSSLWAAWQRISDNECLHAATYSEIVRMSFDNPEKVMVDILSVKESLIRLAAANKVFEDLYEASHKYALRQITVDEAYDKLFMGVVALFLLERLQFMASFAITFTVCGSNYFQPVGKAVQKIAQDELEVHVELDKEVLRIELGTKRGQDAYKRLKSRIKELVDEVVNAELEWTDYLFSEGRELVGTNAKLVKGWVLFNARDVYEFLDIDTDHKLPKTNPMPHVEDWINIGKSQAAPQEQDNNQYKVGTIIRDDDNKEFDVDF